MDFKSIEELMNDYREDAKNIPEAFKHSYILGRLESAYKVLHSEYMRLTKTREKA